MKYYLKSINPALNKLLLCIITVPVLLFPSSSGAQEPAIKEGRRGRLTIDYKSKIDFVAEARKYLKKGDIPEALYNATYAVSNGFDPYDSYLLLADIYRASKDLKSEAYSLEYTVRHAPNDRLKKEAEKRLASVIEAIKNLNIQKSAAAVVKNPDSLNKILRLGHTFERFGSAEKAETQYEYADNLGKNIKSSKYAKIRLYLKNGRRSTALPEVRDFFKLSPEDTTMVYLLAYNGFNLTEIKELGYSGGGGLDMRRYNRTYADYYYEIGYQQYLQEKLDQARTSMLYSLSYFKSNSRAHFNLGEIFYKKGMFRESGFHYSVAYEFMPADYEVGFKLAKSLVMSKSYERARVVLKELLKIDPHSGDYAAWLAKTGLTRRDIERMGYIDVNSPFYKKPGRKKAPAAAGQPAGPENLLKQPPSGLNSPFYQTPQPINIQL